MVETGQVHKLYKSCLYFCPNIVRLYISDKNQLKMRKILFTDQEQLNKESIQKEKGGVKKKQLLCMSQMPPLGLN